MIRTYLRFHTFTLVTWSVIMALFAGLVGLLYESYAGQESLAELYESVPEALQAAIGYEPGLFAGGVVSAEAFIATELYAWWPVVLAVYAVIYAAGAVAGEAERGTLDLVLVQPVPRSRFILGKAAVLLAGLGVVGLVTMAGAEAGLLVTGASASPQGLLAVQVQAWALVAAVAGYALAASALTLSYRATLAWAGGVTVLFYVWDLVTATVDPLEPLAPLSLFSYYRALDLLTTGRPSFPGLAVCGAVALAGLVAALLAFQRRDIRG